MKRSVETERGRIVTAMVVAALLQDTALLIANLASGIAGFFNTVSTSFGNFGHTFSWLFNDQASKYRTLTDREFAARALVTSPDDDADEEEK